MGVGRLLRHAVATHWRTRLLFTRATLDLIEAAILRTERSHFGQIRFAIETALTPMQLLRGMSGRDRAVEVFSALRVWDTERNNGVLVYLLRADRDVEIIADRGFRDRVSPAEWEAVCRLMESHYREGRFREGSVAGVEAIGMLLSRHFPKAHGEAHRADDKLPDRPTLL